MKALIIGASGFVGPYLLAELARDKTIELHATKLPAEPPFTPAAQDGSSVQSYDLDVRDGNAVHALIREINPDHVYHLAALSSIKQSWDRPELTVDINLKGALHLLEALRATPKKPRVLLVGTGEEYGFSARAHESISEDAPLAPGNVYAVTKAAQNLLGAVYAKAYRIPAVMARSFNHIGPGQDPAFAVSDFSRQIAQMEKGLCPPVIRVGNLSAKRDFCDVRDIVRAYVRLLHAGEPGETYNIGSGQAVSIQEILNKLLALAHCPVTIQTEPQRFRPVDIPHIQADTRKLSALFDWKPRYALDDTLLDMLHYWRQAL